MFIAGLAYDNPLLRDEAKIGILVASVAAAVIGSVILATAPPSPIQPAAGAESRG